MTIFSDVELIWKGESYIVRSRNVMKLIAVIEDQIQLPELASPKGAKLTKVACAYHAALVYAGAVDVTPEEVYQHLFADAKNNIGAIINALLSMMVPPNAVLSASTAAPPSKKKKATV